MTPRHQSFIKEKINSPLDKPAFLVMHGGSGSTKEEIGTAVSNGVIKMNVDTDTQWAYWTGLKDFYEKNKEYLQGQVGFTAKFLVCWPLIDLLSFELRSATLRARTSPTRSTTTPGSGSAPPRSP